MFDEITELSRLFKQAIRAVNYNPQLHKEIKEEEQQQEPEDRTGLGKEYGDIKKFDQRYFESLTNPQEIRLYAHRRLQMLGQGSSRAVYVYSPRFALKIAMNDAGIAQNEKEVEISNLGKYDEIISKVFKYDPDYNWVLSELVYPISYYVDEDDHDEYLEQQEFENYQGIPFHSMMHGIDKYYEDAEVPFAKAVKTLPKDKAKETRRKAKLIKELAEKYGLQLSDVKTPSNWGRTSSGKTVLLDFGFDNDIWNTFYRGMRPINWKIDPMDYGNYIPAIDTMKENVYL